MPSVAEVVRRYGPEYLERFGATMPAPHRKVLRAIAGCRRTGPPCGSGRTIRTRRARFPTRRCGTR